MPESPKHFEGRGHLKADGLPVLLAVRYRVTLYPAANRHRPSFRGTVSTDDISALRLMQLCTKRIILELEDGQRLTIVLTDTLGEFVGGGQELRFAEGAKKMTEMNICLTCGSTVIFQPTEGDAFAIDCEGCKLRYRISGTVAAINWSNINRLALAKWIKAETLKGDERPLITTATLERFR
jgi:hypothetical protein